MSIAEVNAAAKAAIEDWIEQDDAPDDNQPDSEPEQEQPEAPKPPAKSASREDESEGEDGKGPDWYHKRLSVVTAKRREAEQERDAQKQRIAELEAALAAKQKSKSVFDDEDDEPEQPPKDKLQARLEAIEKKEAEREFNRFVSEAKAKYPDLPDTVLFSAMANGVDIDDAATAFQTQFEAAIASRLAKQTQAGSTAKKPPVSVGGKASGGAGEHPKPKTSDGRRVIPNVREVARKMMDELMGDDD